MPVFLAPGEIESPRHPAPGLGYRVPLANGEKGTEQTIEVMRQLVDAALNDSGFVRRAVDMVRSAPAFDELSEARAIYDWTRRNIRYTRDPVTKEKLYPPTELLKIRAGDCDDLAMHISASLLAVGINSRWITLATNPERAGEWTHIYAEAEIPAGSGTWIPMDTARIDAEFGIEPPFYYRKRAWDITSDHYEDLSGNLRRRPKFLGAYMSLGQGDGTSWLPVLQQSIAEIPQIISATSGHGAASSPYGAYTSSPYSSFATPLTPGYGIPPAGYTAPGYGLSTSGISLSPTTLLLIGVVVLAFMHGRRY